MRSVVCALAAFAVLASCTQKPGSAFTVSPDSPFIFSTRPQTDTHTLIIIKLKERPLLSSLKREDGRNAVDPVLAEAVATEQEQLLADLAKISTDIKILFRYRMVINGVAAVVPLNVLGKIRGIANVAYAEEEKPFGRPVLTAEESSSPSLTPLTERNSTRFIGAHLAHERGIRGQGMRVGILDTGVDFTHAMLGGAGTEDAYKAVDPSQPNAGFPNAKVVGGIDLVGTNFDSGSPDFLKRIPQGDANPIDEGGHGSHVAGTIAGIGDGTKTYSGVAPDAALYAIKVFGKDGSTGDAVVIAGLEYSADPNADADFADQLHVVNLSLGSSYGEGHVLYAQAIENLSRAGTSVVISAGNSGDLNYVVGTPGVSRDAISVAAGVDDMDQNWKFKAVKLDVPDQAPLYVEAIEGTIGKPIEEAGDVTGPLVYMGLADQDFTDEQKAMLAGKVALIDRGVVIFSEKVRRAAEAGAIGVVVANNQPGSPISMGGDGDYAIPAIMITKEVGDRIKAASGVTTISFQTDVRIEKPELIDTIAPFSSKGPRSMDALIKPEITAPGSRIISAKMGSGAEGVPLSGTSMAAPHMAGVMALLKQAHADRTSDQLKAMVMATAKTISAPDGKPYPISRQGAGRVRVPEALDAKIVSRPSAVSLGEVAVEARKALKSSIELENLSAEPVALTLAIDAHPGLRVAGLEQVSLAPGEKRVLDLRFTLDASSLPTTSTEVEGRIRVLQGATELAHVPVLAVVNKISRVKATKLAVHSTSDSDSQGATARLTLVNRGPTGGEAHVFNYIAGDQRKNDPTRDPYRTRACDLAGSGYRVVQVEGVEMLQIAVKLYEPVTTWDACEVSVMIDGNGDGVMDQELIGVRQDHLAGLTAKTFASILLDSDIARALRRQYELDTKAGKPDLTEDYKSAVLAVGSAIVPEHSTIAIVQAPVALLKLRRTNELSVRIATTYLEGSAIEGDDFLGENAPGDRQKWRKLNVGSGGAAYGGMPLATTVAPAQEQSVELVRGAGKERLWVLYPTNKPLLGGLSADEQSQFVTPTYGIPDLVAGGR